MGRLTLPKDGNVLYARSFGYSQINVTEKKPLIATTKHMIGSIAKTFTAVMIFQLVEEGKLKLTETLHKFFPQIPNAARITIGADTQPAQRHPQPRARWFIGEATENKG